MTILSVFGCLAASLHAAAEQEPARQGATLYVSKLGDNSDGASWAAAFTTIQAALEAVPDDAGGHRVIVRPDTYMEANLAPAHKGAEGAYNLLVGDVDGGLGSGRTGRVVIDAGDPNKGFKSYDWWGTIRAYKQGWSPEHKGETFSAIGWDRWILRNLYATGGDGGFCFDCVDQVKPFTVVVEDCVSLGRAFGGGAMSCLSRPDEPITFRRCTLWALDWWGDTAAAYVRIENEAMPDQPGVYFEDCAMVSPQCALKIGNYGFTTYSRVCCKRCRMVALNFSQPHGTPTDGIIQSVQEGKFAHVELEDCTLMGFKVFGVTVDKDTAGDIAYTTRGDVRAYVQYQQSVPEGFHRLGHWPAEVFDAIAPPSPPPPDHAPAQVDLVRREMCEVSPFIWEGRPLLLACVRPGHAETPEDHYLTVQETESGDELTRFGQGYSLACAHAHQGTLYVFASRLGDRTWNDVTLFKSADLEQWESKVVIEQDPAERLFNSSVCEGPDGFIMAYETNDPAYPAFTVKFARSKDLDNWTKLPDAVFGTDRYTACPCIRYANGYYYMLYLERRAPRWFFETYIARSKDLVSWELSPANPVLTPTAIDDGINASDPDLFEYEGKTYLYYAVGDQRTWMNIKRAAYPCTLQPFLEQWF